MKRNILVALSLVVLAVTMLGGIFWNKTEKMISNETKNTHEEAITPPIPKETAQYPAQIIDLKNWNIMLPVDENGGYGGEPLIIQDLSQFQEESYFFINKDKTAVMFRAPIEGATSENSKYPRSELRELDSDGNLASWRSGDGEHSMYIKQAITNLPIIKPEIVAGQIHDSEDDVIMIRLEKNRLFVERDGEEVALLNDNYQLGEVFSVEIKVKSNLITVAYNGKQKLDMKFKGSGLYFKSGVYTQSNPSKGDKEGAYGEVAVYELVVKHYP